MKELWKNEKGKAGIILGLWLVFIAIILLFLSFFTPKKDNILEATVDTNSINWRLDALMISNIGFKMTIEAKDSSIKRVYDSSFANYEGYVEDSNGINKFRCDGRCYKVFLDHEEEEQIYYDEFLKNIRYLKSLISKSWLNNYTSYLYKDDDEIVRVYVDSDDLINRIIVETEEDKIIYDINYNKDA